MAVDNHRSGIAIPSTKTTDKKMALLLSLLFFSLFSSAILRGKFSYGKGDYVFREHPIQFIAVLLFIFSLSALCFYRFLTES